MITKLIVAYGKELVMACDGRCDKAWGINNRPRTQLGQKKDPDDYVFLADSALGTAPEQPGTWEGGDGKPSGVPITDGSLMNRWCFRECERADSFKRDETIKLRDLEHPEPNIPR